MARLPKNVVFPQRWHHRLRRRPRLAKHLNQHTLSSQLPNFATIMGLCMGMSSIRFALLEKWELAVIAIMIATILDALDGRLARLLGSTSRFGAELDSLSDFVTFGISPSVVLYLFSLHTWDAKGWACVLFFSVCSALRLARFNTIAIEGSSSVSSHGFFVGVPTTVAGVLALMPLIAHLEWGHPFFRTPWIIGANLIVIGILMISPLPTLSLKMIHISPLWIPPALVGMALVAAAIFSAPWLLLLFIGTTYLALLPVGVILYRRRQGRQS